MEAFRTLALSVSDDPSLFTAVFRSSERAGSLLVEHECGRINQAEFEAGFAEELAVRGVTLPAPGFVDAFQALLEPDEEMLAAVKRLRAAGVPVAIVSNSLGDDCYRGFDLAELADASVISSEVGVRKPSRQIYEIACSRLGVASGECVMIDDLEHNLAGSARLGIRGLHHVESARTVAQLDEWFGIGA